MGNTSRKPAIGFDPRILFKNDLETMISLVGPDRLRHPDLIIAPDGIAYLYRWNVVPRNPHCNVYLHVQVRSDPERPLHDHPWENTSHILSGGYEEIVAMELPPQYPQSVHRSVGDVIHRSATMPHRLVLPDRYPYAMTLFITGPKIREWGFWTDEGWEAAKDHIETRDGVSVNVGDIE